MHPLERAICLIDDSGYISAALFKALMLPVRIYLYKILQGRFLYYDYYHILTYIYKILILGTLNMYLVKEFMKLLKT